MSGWGSDCFTTGNSNCTGQSLTANKGPLSATDLIRLRSLIEAGLYIDSLNLIPVLTPQCYSPLGGRTTQLFGILAKPSAQKSAFQFGHCLNKKKIYVYNFLRFLGHCEGMYEGGGVWFISLVPEGHFTHFHLRLS